MTTTSPPTVSTLKSVKPLAFDPDTINYDAIITEDEAPVDNLFSEKQLHLLVDPLYTSWNGNGRNFLAASDVGLFDNPNEPGIAPDTFLSMDVEPPDDIFPKRNRSYFIWNYGKPPEVVIEVVSNQEGEEDGKKMRIYARMSIPCYIIFDPQRHLSDDLLRVYQLRGRRYIETDARYFPEVGLGVTIWNGVYQGLAEAWLRWCDADGNVVPTGAERAEQEYQRAEQERQRATQATQRAEQERQRAEQERQRAERLAAQLRALGINPEA
jgi:Uma2 family endonuclease